MNWLVTIAGVFGAFTTVGHFMMGTKSFLRPMLEASFDAMPKKVMHSVFHYVSAYLILSTLALLGVGLGIIGGEGTRLLVRFIALNYLVFAVWQIALGMGSGIPKWATQLFQWTFFVVIAVLAWIGA